MSGIQGRWCIVVAPEGAARAVGLDVVRAFQNTAGTNAVKAFDCKTYLQAFVNLLKTDDETMAVDLLNQSMAVQCLDFQATHVLVLALSPVTVFTLNLLRKYGVVTVHWFYEDFRAASYWKDVVGGYAFFLAIQRGPIVDRCKKSGAVFHLVPTAASSVGLPRPAPVKSCDVAFIGIPSNYRISILELLASQGVSLAVGGLGWERYRGVLSSFIVRGGWVSVRESMEVLSQSRIGINISVTDPRVDRENTHVSPRVFDIMRAGCVLVTEDVPLAQEILADCKFHLFHSAEHAVEIIKRTRGSMASEASNMVENTGYASNATTDIVTVLNRLSP